MRNRIYGLVDAGLDELSDAVATPCGNDEDFEVFEFDGSRGLELIDEGFGEVFKDAAVFGFDDVVVAVEAVVEGVEAGFEFALVGFGAGAFVGVAVIGSDLLFGSHGFLCLFLCFDLEGIWE